MVKVAIIGAGNMAKCHMEAMASLPDVKISGIYSRTEQSARALADDFDIGLLHSLYRNFMR